VETVVCRLKAPEDDLGVCSGAWARCTVFNAVLSSDGTFKFEEARNQESDDAFVIQRVWCVCTIKLNELTKQVSQ
jgi:hypothetical protein